ncbi:unnamed protein product, partial [Candidula unifasciata]
MTTANLYLLLVVSVTVVYCSKNDNRQKRYLSNSIIIEITNGEVLGLREKIQGRNSATIDVDVFRGIPYAKPPVGDLRFKRPQPSDRWNGVFEATKFPNTCIQVRGFGSILLDNPPPTPLSEDCLYLNIWRPRCPDAGRNMATTLWVHGGFFLNGSTAEPVYNGAALAAFECVIVASVNYRLGSFGFMYTASEEIPGNMGLLDVTLALKWVKDNVDNFGGNPRKITIFGQSSGAAMVSMLLLSLLPRDLFNNAILQVTNPSLTLLIYVSGDIVYECPAIAIATMYAALSQNVYVYRYDYVRERTFLPAWVGATHLSEVPLVFRTITPAYPQISERDAQVNERIMKMWAHFAQSG